MPTEIVDRTDSRNDPPWPASQPISPGETARLGGGSVDSPPINSLTIDLEDYFHGEVFVGQIVTGQWPSLPDRLSATVPPLLDILAEHGVRATFFVLGWVARRKIGRAHV